MQAVTMRTPDAAPCLRMLTTARDQTDKLLSECAEVAMAARDYEAWRKSATAAFSEDTGDGLRGALADELCDVLTVIAGLRVIARITDEDMERAMARTVEKNERRGYLD